MSYPKPLSQKSIEKLYRESGFAQEKIRFLHDFFAACVNLYGAISLRDAWVVYRKLESVPRIQRKELFAFSSIARREAQPYYVFEIEEIYPDEPHNASDCHIVSKDLVGSGYYRFEQLNNLFDQVSVREYCVPEDFLSFANPQPTTAETDLFAFLSSLVSTADTCAPNHGKAIPNVHKGKKLDEFSFLNASERFEAEWLNKQPSAKAVFLEECSGSEAEKIMRFYKKAENIGFMTPTDVLQYTLDELNEAGVEMNVRQIEKLANLITEYHNGSRLWCTAGWKPEELATMHKSSGPLSISFGPGFQKAFADGVMDKEELVRKMREMGIEIIN